MGNETETLTVLMPVFNVAPFLEAAVLSVLAQTFRDFVLLILDDGSRDDTLAIAQRLARADERVRVYTQPNAGIAHTMNRGLELAKTEWVACMHGDDVMLPNRLERQLAFLRANPDLAVASALVYLIDARGRRFATQWSPLTSREAMASFLRQKRCIAFNHPSAILRKRVVQDVGGYRQDFWPAEDADLWNRIAERGYGVLVQPEYLLEYRVHPSSASISRTRLMVRKTDWITACIESRRASRPEPTWDEFLADRGGAPLLARLNASRKETARTLYQVSKNHFASRRYHVVAAAMAAAAVLEPGLILGQAVPRLARMARAGGWVGRDSLGSHESQQVKTGVEGASV